MNVSVSFLLDGPWLLAGLAGGLLLLLLLWTVARARRPPPCDEQEGDQTLG